jgi:hypothetical protein
LGDSKGRIGTPFGRFFSLEFQKTVSLFGENKKRNGVLKRAGGACTCGKRRKAKPLWQRQSTGI